MVLIVIIFEWLVTEALCTCVCTLFLTTVQVQHLNALLNYTLFQYSQPFLSLILIAMFNHCYQNAFHYLFYTLLIFSSEIMVHVVHNFRLSLKHGCKNVYHSLPRLLDIWFDLGTLLTQDIHILSKKYPNSWKSMCGCLDQISSMVIMIIMAITFLHN